VAPERLGMVLAAATAISLVSAPLAGRIGDLLGKVRAVLVACIALAALFSLGYLPAHGFVWLFALSLLRALALAPTTVLSDALALGSAVPQPAHDRRGFEYGWVRGAGSGAFIAGTLISGQLIDAHGLDAIIWLQALLFVAASCAALAVPELGSRTAERHAPASVPRRSFQDPPITPESRASQRPLAGLRDGLADPRTRPDAAVRTPAGGVLVLLRLQLFRTLVLAAALILGSHAMHDGFAMIRWRAAGVGAATASVLWSEAVAAEVLVFFVLGPLLIERLTPAGAIALAAVAGAVRWVVMAETTALFALALVQPLHGITFALLHLACMRVLARIVPPGLEGTAQAIYGTLGIGIASALLTLASGWLYARLGAGGFWAMAALCVLALPVAWKLRAAR